MDRVVRWIFLLLVNDFCVMALWYAIVRSLIWSYSVTANVSVILISNECDTVAIWMNAAPWVKVHGPWEPVWQSLLYNLDFFPFQMCSNLRLEASKWMTGSYSELRIKLDVQQVEAVPANVYPLHLILKTMPHFPIQWGQFPVSAYSQRTLCFCLL